MLSSMLLLSVLHVVILATAIHVQGAESFEPSDLPSLTVGVSMFSLRESSTPAAVGATC